MNDPKKLFVIAALSRKDIANNLNVALDTLHTDIIDEGGKPFDLKKAYFKPNDPRLTDKVCQKIVDKLYDAEAQLGVLDEVGMDTFFDFVGNMPKKMFKK